MRRRRSRYKKPTNANSGTFGLNINSLTDMFVLLLVFLLQFQSTSSVQINPERDLLLPKSTSESNPIEAVQIKLSLSSLKVDEQMFLELDQREFKKADIDSNDTNFIPTLYKELNRIAEEEKAKEALVKAGDTSIHLKQGVLEGRAMLLADAEFTYDNLRRVMYTASMAGFPKLKLATVVGK